MYWFGSDIIHVVRLASPPNVVETARVYITSGVAVADANRVLIVFFPISSYFALAMIFASRASGKNDDDRSKPPLLLCTRLACFWRKKH